MNNQYVTDTVALILRLENRKFPEKVSNCFRQAEKGEGELYIPAMALAEIGYLSENDKIETDLQTAHSYISSNETVKEQSLTKEIVIGAFEITDIPELHDRLIGGTAYSMNTDLLTNDPIIHQSEYVNCIWD